MLTLLFWNIQRKNLGSVVADIVQSRQVDVLMLAESGVDPSEMLGVLNNSDLARFHFSPGYERNNIHIYTNFSGAYSAPISGDNRTTIRHLNPPNHLDVILAVTHLPSKMNLKSSQSQIKKAEELSKMLSDSEEMLGHDRTIVMGDFNMNPFESGMIMASGLNSVMSRKIAQRKTRTINRQQYKFFYNPMWSLFGDATPGPPGTYYYQESDYDSYYWHMLDQILVRPSILEYFDNNNLEVITSNGGASLMKDGRPHSKIYSDHLPILLRIDL